MIDDRCIAFGLWCPTREIFIATIGALTNPLTNKSLAEVDEAGFLVPDDYVRIDEIGPVTKVVATYDEEMNELTPPEIIAGHHVDIYAVGDLAGALTAGMPTEGTIFETTRILTLLGDMEWTVSEVGEPAGYKGTSGIKIFDKATINNPARVLA